MNTSRKKRLIISLAILLFAVLWLAVTGFTVQTAAYMDNFSVSEDGSELTFRVGIASSMGYIRAFRDEGGGVKPHYLKFYSAWGGLNSSLGARDEFTLALSPEDTEIYVYHGENGYDLALQKDEATGEWRRVK